MHSCLFLLYCIKEVLGKTEDLIFFRYHRAADPENAGKFMIFKRNPEAHWFDDYTDMVDEYKVEMEEELV